MSTANSPKPIQFSDLLRGPAVTTRSTVRDVVHGWWMTSRMEYLPDGVVHVGLPLLLVLRHEPWTPNLLWLAFWGAVVWYMGHWVGSSINCLADYPLDRLDVGHKDRLAKAIDRAGMRAIVLVNLGESLLAVAVSVWLAVSLGKPLLLLLWPVGLGVAYLYSFEPFRFKRRNLLNPLALDVIVYILPLFFVYHLFSPVWDGYDVAVLAAYCLQMVPMFLVDEVSDYEEDRALQAGNPCVTYGRVRVTWLAITIYVVGCLTSLVLFVGITPAWTTGRIVALGVGLLAYAWVVWQFVTLAGLSRAIREAPDASTQLARIQTLKDFSKTPAWLVGTWVGVIALAIATAFL